MLFDVFVLAWLLWPFISDNTPRGLVVSVALSLTSFLGDHFFPDVFKIWTALRYFPSFYIGCLMFRKVTLLRFLEKLPWWIWVLLYTALFCVLTLFTAGETDTLALSAFNILAQYLLSLIGSFMAFVVFQMVASSVNWKERKWFTLLSRSSMTMYLLHQQIIYVFIHLFNGKVSPIIHAMLCFVGSVAVSLLLSSLLHRFRLTRFLIGESK